MFLTRHPHSISSAPGASHTLFSLQANIIEENTGFPTASCLLFAIISMLPATHYLLSTGCIMTALASQVTSFFRYIQEEYKIPTFFPANGATIRVQAL
jgi:hypothetical protein